MENILIHSTSFSTVEMDSTDLVDFKISKKFNNGNFLVSLIIL